MSAASIRIAASRARTSRKPIATVNGSLSAAISGGSTALRTPTIAATATAPPKPLSSAPGDQAGGQQQPERRPEPGDRRGARDAGAGAQGSRRARSARRLSGASGGPRPGKPAREPQRQQGEHAHRADRALEPVELGVAVVVGDRLRLLRGTPSSTRGLLDVVDTGTTGMPFSAALATCSRRAGGTAGFSSTRDDEAAGQRRDQHRRRSAPCRATRRGSAPSPAGRRPRWSCSRRPRT